MADEAIAAVILAAGAGSRFVGESHKLIAPLLGRDVLSHAVDAAIEAAIGPVLVVSGALDIAAHVDADVRIVANPRWAQGQSTSLQAGVAAADELGADVVVIGLGDQPFITAAAWREVAASRSPIASASYGGRRGHPVRLHRATWPLLPTTGDGGARTLLRLRPDLVEAVPCEGSPTDIDTVEDLRRWQNDSSTSSP